MAEPLNATFFAFRKRERGGVLLTTTLAYVVLAIIIGAVFALLNWRGVADYINWTMSLSTGAYDPTNASTMPMPPASVMALFPAYFLYLFVTYLLLAAYEAACLKWMIHGEREGLFGLSLGADTWRVWAGYWMWLLLILALYIVCFAVSMVFMGSMVAAGAGANTDPSAMASMGLGALAFLLLILIVVIYFSVRLSPAAATSIARRRFSFFQAWTVTKGRFWALLGAFVLLWLMCIVGFIILYAAFAFAVIVPLIAQSSTTGAEPTSEQVMQMFASPTVWGPFALVYLVAIIGTFVWLIAVFGVNARAAQAALEEGKIKPAA